MTQIAGLLTAVDQLRIPERITSALPRIEKERQHLDTILASANQVVYGANTLTGHRDSEVLERESNFDINTDILTSHAIAGGEHYSPYQARCISYARLYSMANGGTGVSVDLYKALTHTVNDPRFRPLIPRHASYSSGDVIPASHWATQALEHMGEGVPLHAGDAMALINGSFVQTGHALSLTHNIKTNWRLFVHATKVTNQLAGNAIACEAWDNPEAPFWVQEAIGLIARSSQNDAPPPTQLPISLRAIPEVIESLGESIDDYFKTLNRSLDKRSTNPLINTRYDYPLSQGSFLNPAMTLRTSSLVDALLFAGWSIVARCQFLLSGKIKGVPQDGANEATKLGLIQYPKLMMALLEKSRSDFASRAFSHGGSTSYGIEDLWTHGASSLNQLEHALDQFQTMCHIEVFILDYLHHHCKAPIDSDLFSDHPVAAGDSLSDYARALRARLARREEPEFIF